MVEVLKNFTQKDILEQLDILDHINKAQQKETISDLFELLAGKKCQQATHEMIYHTLFSLMKDDEESIRKGILHPSFRVKLLSIRRCRKSKTASAVPELVQILETSDDMEVIGEIIVTLGSFKDPDLLPILRPYLFHTDPSVVSWAMEALSSMESHQFGQILRDLIQGDKTLYATDQECSLATILAVEHLAKLDDEVNRNFLLSYRKHPHPIFRNAVNKALNPS